MLSPLERVKSITITNIYYDVTNTEMESVFLTREKNTRPFGIDYAVAFF